MHASSSAMLEAIGHVKISALSPIKASSVMSFEHMQLLPVEAVIHMLLIF